MFVKFVAESGGSPAAEVQEFLVSDAGPFHAAAFHAVLRQVAASVFDDERTSRNAGIAHIGNSVSMGRGCTMSHIAGSGNLSTRSPPRKNLSGRGHPEFTSAAWNTGRTPFAATRNLCM